jgi:cytochrome c553
MDRLRLDAVIRLAHVRRLNVGFYTTVQLLMFRDRLRVSEPMNEMAKGLSDGDLQKAADVISKLPPP